MIRFTHLWRPFAALVVMASLIAASGAHAQAPQPGNDIPDTPAGHLLEWFVALVEAPNPTLVAERLGSKLNGFDPPTADRMSTDLARVSQKTGGFVVMRTLEVDALEMDVLMRAANSRSWWIVTIGAEPAPPHRLSTLRLRPLVEEPTTGVGDWGDVGWGLDHRDRPPNFSLLAERVNPDGRSKALIQLGATERGAIGPASKLFVATLFAEEVLSNPALLDEGVPFEPSLRSLGAGEAFRDTLPGERIPATDLVVLMLQGNLTAMDQLLGWLGRPAIERLAAEVQGDGSPNIPFLFSNEFFRLKLLDDADLYRRFSGAETEDERRLVLTEVARTPMPTMEAAEAIKKPTRVRDVEWRASARELCDLIKRIETAMDADTTGRVRESLNEISPLNRQMGVWSFVMRITGGEPGVQCDAFLLERLDGVRFRFAVVSENPDEEIDYPYFGSLPATIITLMALEP